MTTTNITTYKTGTTQEILNLDPSTPGTIAIATDTNNMFISNGTGWSETVVNKRLGLQHSLTNGETIGETPILHFDANNRNTLLNAAGSTCVDGDEVAIWNSLKSSERFIQDVHSRPTYVAQDANNKPGVNCDPRDGMFLDTAITPKRSGSFSFILVYTPTRQDHERVYTGPGDSSTSSTNVGGRYSYSKFQTRYATSFYEHLFASDYNRSAGRTSDTIYAALYQYANDNTMELWHAGGHLDYFAQLDGRYDKTLLYDDNTVDDYFHYNENYRGKPQILSVRVNATEGKDPTFMSVILHTWHNQWLNSGRNIYNSSINTPNPTLHKMNIGGYGLLDTPTAYLSPNMYHELLVFGSYLSDKDLNTLGTQLYQKWGTRFWDLTFEI